MALALPWFQILETAPNVPSDGTRLSFQVFTYWYMSDGVHLVKWRVVLGVLRFVEICRLCD